MTQIRSDTSSSFKTRRRFERAGDARFLTFSCYKRRAYLAEREIADDFARQLFLTRQRLGIRVLAWVVMPEHVHLLVIPSLPEAPVSRILSAIKRPIAKRWVAGVRQEASEPFWQRGGGYDRNIFSRKEVEEKIAYIHANPVRRGLVRAAEEYRWSSLRACRGMETEWGEIDRVRV